MAIPNAKMMNDDKKIRAKLDVNHCWYEVVWYNELMEDALLMHKV